MYNMITCVSLCMQMYGTSTCMVHISGNKCYIYADVSCDVHMSIIHMSTAIVVHVYVNTTMFIVT